jgi:hypothetical protein
LPVRRGLESLRCEQFLRLIVVGIRVIS